MANLAYTELLKQVETLEVEEQLRLAAYVLEHARHLVARARPRRQWREVCGLYPYPMLGEDAQAWVSRTRSEADAQRAQSWETRA